MQFRTAFGMFCLSSFVCLAECDDQGLQYPNALHDPFLLHEQPLSVERAYCLRTVIHTIANCITLRSTKVKVLPTPDVFADPNMLISKVSPDGSLTTLSNERLVVTSTYEYWLARCHTGSCQRDYKVPHKLQGDLFYRFGTFWACFHYLLLAAISS